VAAESPPLHPLIVATASRTAAADRRQTTAHDTDWPAVAGDSIGAGLASLVVHQAD
jgi:acetyl esterase/lipase